MTLQLDIVTPAKLMLSREADMVVVPGAEGDMGLLENHAPLISTLRPGMIRVYTGDKVDETYFVRGGFVEVTGKRCTLLAETATDVADMNKATVQEQLAEARRMHEKTAAKADKDEIALDELAAEIEALEIFAELV